MRGLTRNILVLFACFTAKGLGAASLAEYLATPAIIRGAIYEPGKGQTNAVYLFERQVERKGEDIEVIRTYTDRKGELVARELASYNLGKLKAFTLEEQQIHAVSTVTVKKSSHGETLEFEKVNDTRTKAKPNKESESYRGITLTSDLVVPFIQSRWTELTNGRPLKVRFAAVQRCQTVGFTLSKDGERKYKGMDAVVIKMEATSAIIAALVDPLYFVLERSEPHRILEYRGRTAPKIKVGNKWKDFEGVTVFER